MATAPYMSTVTPKPRGSERRVLIWISAGVILMVAAALLLQLYANGRRDIIRQLERLENIANVQASLEWRAIAESSGTPGDFPGMRFEADRAGLVMYEYAAKLSQLEHRGRWLNTVFGFSDTQKVQEETEYAVNLYQSSVNGLFGQLSTGMLDMAIGSRNYSNPEFDYLHETLTKISSRNQTLATRASRTANTTNIFAVLATLFCSIWIAQRLSRTRARRALDLQEERLNVISESEARFKALVQNADGLIAVLENDSRVRYASPATQALLGQDADSTTGKFFWSEVLNVADADAHKLDHDDKELPLELRIRRNDGEQRELEVRVQNHLDHPHLQGIVVNAHDITERKTLEHQLRYQALHDPLTDLPNRRFFAQRLETALAETLNKVAVLFIDLEGIKLVNDSFGHDRGDLLLLEASRRIGHCLRSEDTLGRLGGDELVAVLPSVLDENSALEVSKRILKALTLPFTIESQDIFLNPSIGISLNTSQATPNDLVRHAGIAMYQAKREVKGILFFESQMGEEAPERLRLESDMRRGLEKDEFTVYYQPKVDLKTGKIVSLEALVRWQHPKRGFVSPAKFIPFAEETGLIEPLGKIVLETACRQAVSWQPKKGAPLVMAVNLSAIQFRNPNLVQDIAEILIRSGLPPQALELEITESAVLGDVNATIRTLEELKQLGIRLAIDDFGTGYSNLGHLRRFPVDVLKIDQSFVKGMSGKDDDTPIVEAVISLAKALNLHVVAEGVETAQQMKQLKDMGCDLGQGYYFAKPLPSEAIAEMLTHEIATRAAS
jgi:diguanylate cyclase (GGDEF)-like protein/PAS domain S-box-containing protein